MVEDKTRLYGPLRESHPLVKASDGVARRQSQAAASSVEEVRRDVAEPRTMKDENSEERNGESGQRKKVSTYPQDWDRHWQT